MKKLKMVCLGCLITVMIFSACKKESRETTAQTGAPKSFTNSTLAYPDDWEQLTGMANDISVGAKGTICITDNTPTSNGEGFEVQKWNGSNWTTLAGSGVRLAVDTAGIPWVINKSHQIYKINGSTPQLLPGAATDIGIGANGAVYITDTTVVSPTGGFRVLKWNGSSFVVMSGAAGVKIAVDPNGYPWVVNKSNLIYRYNGTSWTQLSGQATDIGIGANGTVYIASNTLVSSTGGYRISKWNGTGFTATVSGAGVAVSVDPAGHPYAVNASNLIYRNLNL